MPRLSPQASIRAGSTQSKGGWGQVNVSFAPKARRGDKHAETKKNPPKAVLGLSGDEK